MDANLCRPRVWIWPILALAAGAALATEGQASARAWANDVEWQVSPAKGASLPAIIQRKLFVIAPVHPATPQVSCENGFGAHDQVIPPYFGVHGLEVSYLVAGSNASSSNVGFRTIAAPRGNIELLYAADLDADGRLENLTSYAKILRALSMGLAAEADANVARVLLLAPMNRAG
jgi:hypothetical protein